MGCNQCSRSSTFTNNLNPFLHEDLLHLTTASSSSTRPCSSRTTEGRRKSIGYSTVQGHSVQHSMRAVSTSRLLRSVYSDVYTYKYNGIFNNTLHDLPSYDNLSLLKLNFESDSLLLEDKRKWDRQRWPRSDSFVVYVVNIRPTVRWMGKGRLQWIEHYQPIVPFWLGSWSVRCILKLNEIILLFLKKASAGFTMEGSYTFDPL